MAELEEKELSPMVFVVSGKLDVEQVTEISRMFDNTFGSKPHLVFFVPGDKVDVKCINPQLLNQEQYDKALVDLKEINTLLYSFKNI